MCAPADATHTDRHCTQQPALLQPSLPTFGAPHHLHCSFLCEHIPWTTSIDQQFTWPWLRMNSSEQPLQEARAVQVAGRRRTISHSAKSVSSWEGATPAAAAAA